MQNPIWEAYTAESSEDSDMRQLFFNATDIGR